MIGWKISKLTLPKDQILAVAYISFPKFQIFFSQNFDFFLSNFKNLYFIKLHNDYTFGWFFFLFRHLMKCLVMIRKIIELLEYFMETNYSYDTCEYLLRILWKRRFWVANGLRWHFEISSLSMLFCDTSCIITSIISKCYTYSYILFWASHVEMSELYSYNLLVT